MNRNVTRFPEGARRGCFRLGMSSPPPGSLGSKVLHLRELKGPERERATAQFLSDAAGFIRAAVRRFAGDDVDGDELRSAAVTGLLEAVASYRPEAGRFDQHARWAMRGQLARVLRASRLVRGPKHKYKFRSIDAPGGAAVADRLEAGETEAGQCEFAGSATVREALERAGLEVVEGRRLSRIASVEATPEALHALACLVDALHKLPALPMTLHCAAPRSLAVEKVISAPGRRVQFGCREWALELPSAALRLPLRTKPDAQAVTLARELARECAVLAERSDLVSRLRRVLLERLPFAPTVTDIARALGLSSRSLQRQLGAAGLDFRDELVKLRVALAKRWARTSEPVDAVAARLGYSSASVFSRAFHTATGAPPRRQKWRVLHIRYECKAVV